MNKYTTKPIPPVAAVKTTAKPALGECVLAVASALIRGCEARGHFKTRSRNAPAAIIAEPDALVPELEFADSFR